MQDLLKSILNEPMVTVTARSADPEAIKYAKRVEKALNRRLKPLLPKIMAARTRAELYGTAIIKLPEGEQI